MIFLMNALPLGIIPQLYLDKLPAAWTDRATVLDAAFVQFLARGVRAVAVHGFSTTLTPSVFRRYAALCKTRGLACLAAFGMDSSDPTGKADRIGAVLVLPECDGVVLDAEDAWEDEDDDLAKAAAFRDRFLPWRARAPGKVVVDQPWPVPTVHRTWPYEQFAACVDLRCPQDYYNDWKSVYGRDRYAKLNPRFAASWAEMDARLDRFGLRRPLGKTIQAYAWGDILPDLCDCLLRNPTVIAWAEPLPDAAFMRCALGVEHLRAKCEAAGVPCAPDAVRWYQQAYNGSGATPRLTVDGRMGELTLAALGAT